VRVLAENGAFGTHRGTEDVQLYKQRKPSVVKPRGVQLLGVFMYHSPHPASSQLTSFRLKNSVHCDLCTGAKSAIYDFLVSSEPRTLRLVAATANSRSRNWISYAVKRPSSACLRPITARLRRGQARQRETSDTTNTCRVRIQ